VAIIPCFTPLVGRYLAGVALERCWGVVALVRAGAAGLVALAAVRFVLVVLERAALAQRVQLLALAMLAQLFATVKQQGRVLAV